MGLALMAAEVATAINVVVLAALSVVWARNYRELRSKHALGLLVFGLLLAAENALSLYFYTMDPHMAAWYRDPNMVPSTAMRGMMYLHILELGGVAFLAWITWD